MARTKISHKPAVLAEELLQAAELRGSIRLRLQFMLEVPRNLQKPLAGVNRWIRLPFKRPTIKLVDAEGAWEAIEAIDELLHNMTKGAKRRTTKETKRGHQTV